MAEKPGLADWNFTLTLPLRRPVIAARDTKLLLGSKIRSGRSAIADYDNSEDGGMRR